MIQYEIITPVGTSILSNFSDEDKNRNLRTNERATFAGQIKSLEQTIRGKQRRFNQSDWVRLTEDWEDEDDFVPNSSLAANIIQWAKKNKEASAELKSIFKIQEEKENADIRIELLTSDTMDGYCSAWMLKSVLKDKGIESNIEIIKGLVVDEGEQLTDDAFDHLIVFISQRKKDYDKWNKEAEKWNKEIEENPNLGEARKKRELLLNITAGYKATIPFLTLIGQLYHIPLYYIYEKSNSLIELERFPFHFDWEFGELYYDYLTSNGLNTINQNGEVLQRLRNMGLIQKYSFKLTTLGKLFKTHVENLLNPKKGALGYLVELKVFQYFIQKDKNTIQGKKYSWDVRDKAKFYETSQFNWDSNRERAIDIDVFIKDKSLEEWYEVKSYSETGLKKGSKTVGGFV